jgi:hypothetical protein
MLSPEIYANRVFVRFNIADVREMKTMLLTLSQTLRPTGNSGTKELQTLLFCTYLVVFIALHNLYRHGPLNTLRYLLKIIYISF